MTSLVLYGGGIAIVAFLIAYLVIMMLQHLWEKGKQVKPIIKNKEPPVLMYSSVAGAFLGFILALGSNHIFQGVLLGFCIGAIASVLAKKASEDTAKIRQMKELAVIYDTSVFYASAGYTLKQALEKSKDLIKILRPSLEKCLAAWPYGSVRALYQFGEEVDIPEAKVMAGIFAHVEEKGASFSEAAILEESQSLENLRKTLAELKILNKPLYFAVYRALPLLAVCGVIVGSLIYRVLQMLSTLMSI